MLETKTAKRFQSSSGFTLTELLIVIVVIAILAAIAFLSYNGMSKRATVSAIKSDLNTGSKMLELHKISNGSYPSDPRVVNGGTGIPSSNEVKLGYVYDSSNQSYCLHGKNSRGDLSLKTTGLGVGSVADGDCGSTAIDPGAGGSSDDGNGGDAGGGDDTGGTDNGGGRYIQCVFVPQRVLDHLATTYPGWVIEDVSCESRKYEIDLERRGTEYEYRIEYDRNWNITDVEYSR